MMFLWCLWTVSRPSLLVLGPPLGAAPLLPPPTAPLCRLLLVQNTCQVTGSQSGKLIHSTVFIHGLVKYLSSPSAPGLGVNDGPRPLGCIITLGFGVKTVLKLVPPLAGYHPGNLYFALLKISSFLICEMQAITMQEFRGFNDNSIQWLAPRRC